MVGGTDGTLFCFGHANLGKSYTMVGSDESSRTVSGCNNTMLIIQYGEFPKGVGHRVENGWGLTKVAVVLLNGLLW